MSARANVSAMNPQWWASVMQIPLRRSLVAAAVANTQFEPMLTMGDTVHFPYWEELEVTDYTPGTDITGAQDITATDETLVVDKKKVVRFYVDDIEALQAKYSYAMTLADEGAYKLRDQVDRDVLAQVANAASALDGGDVGGTAGSAISSTTANIIDTFVQARRKMRQMNIEEANDWIGVVTPKVAANIEQKTTDSGFSVADASLRNGFAGTFVGFRIYVSNNLPTATYGGETSDLLYVGRARQIHLAIQRSPTVTIRDAEKRLGRYFYPNVVYGTKTFEKPKRRFLRVPVRV